MRLKIKQVLRAKGREIRGSGDSLAYAVGNLHGINQVWKLNRLGGLVIKNLDTSVSTKRKGGKSPIHWTKRPAYDHSAALMILRICGLQQKIKEKSVRVTVCEIMR